MTMRRFRYPPLIAAAVLVLYLRPFLNGAPAVNILLHAAVVCGVFLLCRELGFRSLIAAGAALVFAFHPKQLPVVLSSDGVTYILCTLLALTAMILALRPWKRGWDIGIPVLVTALQMVILYLRSDYLFLPVMTGAVVAIYQQRFDWRSLAVWCLGPLAAIFFLPMASLLPGSTILTNWGIAFWQTLIPLEVPVSLIPFWMMLMVLLSVILSALPRNPAFVGWWIAPGLFAFAVSPLLLNRNVEGAGYAASLFLWLPLFAAAQSYWRDRYKIPVLIGGVIYTSILLAISALLIIFG